MNEKRSDSESTNEPDHTLGAPTPRTTATEEWTYETQAHYDPDELRDLTTVIIGAIADTEGVPVTEITNPPLYEVVDVTGIEDALFGRPEANWDGTDSTAEFQYNGYKISVKADGWVTVSSRPEGSTAERDRDSRRSP